MIHIYTPSMVKVGVIADYESLIFTKKFYNFGGFEMYINVNKQYTEELKMWNIIQVNDEKDNVGFITHRSLPLNDNGESGETLFIKGFTLDGLTANRNIVPDSDKAFMSFEGNQEYIMKQFVYHNMINAIDSDRNIQGLKLSADKGYGKQDKWRGRHENLAEKLSEIGIYSSLGWDITFDNHKKEFVFDIMKGIDRQVGNGKRSHVVFELSFGNILSREFTEDITNSKNVIYAGGQGELEEKLIQKVGAVKGFERIEAYQDYSNIDDITELRVRAEQTVEELKKTETFNVVVSPKGSYNYKEDYFLGDYVTVIDRELNIRVDTQITSIKEINEGLSGIEITFGKMIPTILNTISTSNNSKIMDIPDKAEEPEQGLPGKDGIGLEYNWSGTQLGIKREDDTDYAYEDLQGPQGKQGIQGIQGIQGLSGLDGESLEFHWNSTQLGIRVEGQTSYQYVNLKGDKGNQGLQGIQGVQGIQGKTGPMGPRGKPIEYVWNGTKLGIRVAGEDLYQYVDLKGEKGPIGDAGPQGPIGKTGAKGEQGIQGLKGDIGPRGLQGLKGDTGSQGPRGEKGDKGDPFVYSDFTVPQLLELKGPKGDKGDTGPRGPQGIQGPKGDAIADSVEWNKVLNKPNTFKPSSHTQGWDTITQKPSIIEVKTQSFYVDGDADTFYPVVFSGVTGDTFFGGQLTHVYRWYSEAAPPWGSSTHKGGLNVKLENYLADWGGMIYYMDIMFSQTYAQVIADIQVAGPDTNTIIMWLRGGHAKYHLETTAPSVTINPVIGTFVYKEGTRYERSYPVKTSAEKLFVRNSRRNKIFGGINLYAGSTYNNPSTAKEVFHGGNFNPEDFQKTIKDEETTNEYEFTIKDGKPYLKVTK